MIIYIKCACTSKDRLWVTELRKNGHEVRLLKDWREEVKLYNLPLPFKVIDEAQKIGERL